MRSNPFLRLTAGCIALICGLSAAMGKDYVPFGGLLSQDTGAETLEYRDLEAGENALKSGNYETAADYFKEYRLKANLAGDTIAAEDALSHELHACIAANLADRAQKLLDEFRGLYPAKRYDCMLYQAQIYLLQRRYDDAKKLVTALRQDTSVPVTLQNLLCEVAIAEHEKDDAKALEIYNEIVRQTGRKSMIGGRADERKVLLLAEADKLTDARKELNLLLQARSEEEPVPVRNLDVNQLFLFFCDLKENGSKPLTDKLSNDWTEKIRKSPHADEIFYVVATRIASLFVQRDDIVRGSEAYYLAQQCAPVREDAVQAVMNLLAVYNMQADKKQAAAYAEDMLKLFSLADLTPEQGIQTARILFAGGRNEKGIGLCLQILKPLPNNKIGDIYRLSLSMALETKAYAEAKQLITFSDTLIPAESVSLAFDYAHVLELEWNYTSAVKKYDEILKMPNLSKEDKINALRSGMHASAETGNQEDVVRFGTQLLQEDSSQVSALASVAKAEMQLKKYHEAYSHFSKFASLAPHATDKEQEDVSLALYKAAECALKIGDNTGIIKSLETLTAQYPKTAQYVQGMSLLVRAYFRMDEAGKAKTAANTLFNAFPNNSDTINTMLFSARQFFSSQEYDDADSFLAKLRDVKDFPAIQQETYYLSARISMEKNDIATANLYLDEMKKNASPSDELYLTARFLQGEILRKNKDFEKARKEYTEILKTTSTSLTAQVVQQAIGDTYFEEADLQASATATNDSAELEKLESKKATIYGSALAEYQKLLTMTGLTPEMKSIACYKTAKTSSLIGKKHEVAKALLDLYALCNAAESDLHPEISYWIIRGVLLAEDIANSSDSDYDIAHTAEQGLKWLGDTGKINAITLEARIGRLQKLPQYQKPQPMKDK